MNVLFVHGFGGAGGGRMEKALARVQCRALADSMSESPRDSESRDGRGV